MALMVVLTGGMLGFASALLSLFLGAGFLAAFGLWMSVGLCSVALAGLFACLPRRMELTVDA